MLGTAGPYYVAYHLETITKTCCGSPLKISALAAQNENYMSEIMYAHIPLLHLLSGHSNFFSYTTFLLEPVMPSFFELNITNSDVAVGDDDDDDYYDDNSNKDKKNPH